MKKVVVTKVDMNRWEQAQKFESEFAERTNDSGDDWNHWWKKAFNNYKAIKGQTFTNVLEVGCGPHTNIRLILPMIKAVNVYLEDPLIQKYLDLAGHKVVEKRSLLGSTTTTQEGSANNLSRLFFSTKYRVDLSSALLEYLPYQDGLMDLVVCINVLDHVADLDKCMRHMDRVLKKGGVIIIGQDLSNEEDYKQYPESWDDVGHPIKVDDKTMNSYFKGYKKLFYEIIPRGKGRNPVAHYGTYILVAQKK